MRATCFILRGFCLVAALALGSTACDRHQQANTRAIVLGFDGLDYDLTRTLMEAGRLPNFSRLARQGRFSALGTTMPPQSPVAWSSFTTGLAPDQHGIFDFIHRDPATLLPYLSTTRTDPPRWPIEVGHWRLPLRGGRVTSLRDGQPFWAQLEREGVRTTILRMPANYPPSGRATRELSGMGTPDLLGTYGTFSFFTSDAPLYGDHAVAGGKVFPVRVERDVLQANLEGPDHPYRTDRQTLMAPFTVYRDARAEAARIVIGSEERVLNTGEWSDWVPVTFRLTSLQSLHGMCQFYLKQVRPVFELYVTPINLDPLSPALPISTPSSYAATLARATGRFYTQGMPEDTKALSAGVFDADDFLRQAANSASENMRQFAYVLDQFHDGLLFHYFGHVDLVSHMMWRSMDPEAPAYNASRDEPYRHVIEDLYAGLDGLVGRTMARMPADTLLVVLSDHGFASWRRTFNLNRWLEQHGYLTVSDPARRGESLTDIDWSHTRAYGLGLNGLYINVTGREKFGIVDPADREPLAREIRRALLETIDPATHARAITAIHLPPEEAGVPPAGAGARAVTHPERAPDLIVGYAKGTRVSNDSALGAVPATNVFTDNTEAWSGDHCMDPAGVPGVLFSNRPLPGDVKSLQDVPNAIINALGVSSLGRDKR
jgi:predicted AlkP superfamily phosphohydrolase/phosphomutase